MKLAQRWRLFGKGNLRAEKEKLLQMKNSVMFASGEVEGEVNRLANFNCSFPQ